MKQGNRPPSKKSKSGGDEDEIPEKYRAKIKSLRNTPDDNKAWIEERKRSFPRIQQVTSVSPPRTVENVLPNAVASYFSAYVDSDDDDDDKKDEQTGVAAPKVELPPPPPAANETCRFFVKNGSCKYGEKCRHVHPPNHENPKPFSKPQQKSSLRFSKSTLLTKLLESEMDKEAEMVLEAIYYLVSVPKEEAV